MSKTYPAPKPGDRIGAFVSLDMKEKTAIFLGYGVYDGKYTPPTEYLVEMLAHDRLASALCVACGKDPAVLREMAVEFVNGDGKNHLPKIARCTLDTGEVIWAGEAKIGVEELIREAVAKLESEGFKIVLCRPLRNKAGKCYDFGPIRVN